MRVARFHSRTRIPLAASPECAQVIPLVDIFDLGTMQTYAMFFSFLSVQCFCKIVLRQMRDRNILINPAFAGENACEMLQAHSFEALQLHSLETLQMDSDAFPVVQTADESSFGSLYAERAVAALQMEHHGHARGTDDVQHRRLLHRLIAVDQVIDALKDPCRQDSPESQGDDPMHNAKQQYQGTPSADTPEESSSRGSTPRPGMNLLRRGCSGAVSDKPVPVQDDEIPGNCAIIQGLRSCICNDTK